MKRSKPAIAFALLVASSLFAGDRYLAWQHAADQKAEHLRRQAMAEQNRLAQQRLQAEAAADLATLAEMRRAMPAGPDTRAAWPQLIERTANELALAELTYEIQPPRDDEGLPSQRIALHGRLHHEGEFLRLLDGLAAASGALIRLDDYRLVRQDDQLSFDCTMRWLTLPAATESP